VTFGPAFERLLSEIEREHEQRQREEANRGWRAMMLAPTLEIYRALLRGESVPVSALDPLWVRRFGVRQP
jgi:hypothetical protein